MGWVVLGIIVLLVIFVVGLHNGLVTARNAYKNAFAQIDVQLTRRHDLIPNLVETAKGYLAHERNTLEAVITARNAAVSRRQGSGRLRSSHPPDGFQELKTRHIARCPFVDLPHAKSSRWDGGVTAEEMREMQWVTPDLVAQIRFVEWTAEGRLRHAAFLGLRMDKTAREVRRDTSENASN